MMVRSKLYASRCARSPCEPSRASRPSHPDQGGSEATLAFQDRIMVFTVMDFRTDTQFLSLRHLERLKTLLRRKCEQLEILVIVQELLAIGRNLLR